MEVRLAAELPSKATFEVLIRPLSNVPATESKSLAANIRASLEPSLLLTKNPRSLVQLVIQSLSPFRTDIWNTNLAAAMINASTLSLLNAGSVPMRGVVTAVAVSKSGQGALVVDPSDEELETSEGRGCFAFMFSDDNGPQNDHCVCVWTSWSWRSLSGGSDETVVFEAQQLAKSQAKAINTLIRRHVAKIFRADVEEEDGSDESDMVI